MGDKPAPGIQAYSRRILSQGSQGRLPFDKDCAMSGTDLRSNSEGAWSALNSAFNQSETADAEPDLSAALTLFTPVANFDSAQLVSIQQPLQEGSAASVKISPNPADVALELRLESAQGTTDVELTNLVGTVLRRTVISGSTPTTIETASLPSGIYLLHSKAEGQAVQVQKVIIQH